MNRLRQPADSHYDVLGLSPKATDQEINAAFAKLIDGGGYKVGIPLNRQWLRARQIKEAYATLADPAERRAYDESLGRAPESAAWAMTANDPGTDELVLSEDGPIAPADALQKAAPPPESEPPPAPEIASEPAEEEAVGLGDESPSRAELDPALNDNEPRSALAHVDERPVSARTWGVAAAVTIGLGALLIGSWPGWNDQPSTSDGTSGVAVDAWQASEGRLGLAPNPTGNPDSFDGAPAVDSGQQADPAGDSPAASDANGRPTELQSSRDEPTPQDAGQLAASNAADTRSAAAATPRRMSSATGVSSARMETPAVPARAPVAPAIAGESTSAESSASPIRTPPEWIGGGPTDADNPRGRYQGTVAVQVTVEAGGRVSKCAPVRGSGNAGLDAMTCRLVQERARFTPALDAQGRPVESQTYTTFFWGRKPPR